MVAAATIGAGVIGAVGSVAGSSIARGGAQQATQTQQQALNLEQQMAQPYATAGQTAEQQILGELQGGQLGQPAPTDLSAISRMPGYQFTLQQGLLSTQNAAAAQGLGVSGAALMGAANYATGLAQSNYQQYFNDYWANQNNRFNMLSNLVGTGANAAVGAGSNVANTSTGIAQQQLNTAAAGASGLTGVSNAAANTLASPAVQNYLMGQGGSTITPNQLMAASNAQQSYFAANPAGTYGPGQG